MKRGIINIVVLTLVLLGPATAAADEPNGGNSNSARACQQGGWRAMVGSRGETFANAGQCVSFAAQGGTFASGLVIPEGGRAVLTDARFRGACDPLVYGYQVNFGPFVPVDSKPFGCGPVPLNGATIGPFPTAVLLRIFLIDNYCGGGPDWIYFSDGNHGLVTPVSSGTFVVDMTDSFLCQLPNSDPRVPSGPGHGDLTLTVVIST